MYASIHHLSKDLGGTLHGVTHLLRGLPHHHLLHGLGLEAVLGPDDFEQALVCLVHVRLGLAAPRA